MCRKLPSAFNTCMSANGCIKSTSSLYLKYIKGLRLTGVVRVRCQPKPKILLKLGMFKANPGTNVLVHFEIEKWCRHEESNPGPTDYKSVALPTELRRQY